MVLIWKDEVENREMEHPDWEVEREVEGMTGSENLKGEEGSE